MFAEVLLEEDDVTTSGSRVAESTDVSLLDLTHPDRRRDSSAAVDGHDPFRKAHAAVSETPSETEEAWKTLLESVSLDRASTVYISTPITTGKAYYLALRDSGAGSRPDAEAVAAARALAMERNRSAAEATLESAQNAGLGRNHINPTVLVVEHWTQEQYLAFWLSAIDRWVGSVVLAPGWEYSNGSAQEVVHAFGVGLPVFDSELQTVSPTSAYAALMAAQHDIESMGFQSPKLVESMRSLNDLIDENAKP